MYSFSPETVMRQVVVHSINLYQKNLSPHKGFDCPHRLLYGEASCSSYVKTSFLNQDLGSAIRLSSQRFRDCSLASQILKSQKSGSGCIVIPCCIPI